MSRSAYPLAYQGRPCPEHRSSARLVDTHECLDCAGPDRILAMQQEHARQEGLRRARRILYELSDGGQTGPQLLEATGGHSTELRAILESLVAMGAVVYGEEQTGRHRRWLWRKAPGAAQKALRE